MFSLIAWIAGVFPSATLRGSSNIWTVISCRSSTDLFTFASCLYQSNSSCTYPSSSDVRRSSRNLPITACQSCLFEGWILPAVVTRASLISRHKNKNWKSSAIYISDFTWSYTASKLWSVFNGWVSHPVTGGMRLQIVLRNQKGRVTSKSFDLPYTPGEESRQSRCGFAALSSFFIAWFFNIVGRETDGHLLSKVRLLHLLTVKKHGGNYLYYSSNGVFHLVLEQPPF